MLSRSGVHAIRAMTSLAALSPGEYTGVGAIARETGAPRNYLGKLLFQLSRRGLVESRKGLGGGFRLTRRPDEICLLDIIAGIEDVARWSECALDYGICSNTKPCMVHTRWTRVRDAFLSFLRDTNLAELAVMQHASQDPVPVACELRAFPEQS